MNETGEKESSTYKKKNCTFQHTTPLSLMKKIFEKKKKKILIKRYKRRDDDAPTTLALLKLAL